MDRKNYKPLISGMRSLESDELLEVGLDNRLAKGWAQVDPWQLFIHTPSPCLYVPISPISDTIEKTPSVSLDRFFLKLPFSSIPDGLTRLNMTRPAIPS